MAAYPFPGNLALRNFGIEYFPEVKILAPFPSQRHRFDEILAVATNGNVDTRRQPAQRFNCRSNFHSIVGGRAGGPGEFELGAVIGYEHNSPAARSGVPEARPIRIGDQSVLLAHSESLAGD
jgi:hypothetical protein